MIHHYLFALLIMRHRLSQKQRNGGRQTGQKSDAFVSDLENALKLLALHPGIGARATNMNLENVRRVHLARVHYHLITV